MQTRTIDDYMDAAKKTASLSSDRQLSLALGITNVSVNAWRQKKAWPKDEMIIRLAELAGLDPYAALIDLNRWRAKDPTAQKTYAALLRKMQRAGVAAAVAGTLVALSLVNTTDAALAATMVTGTNAAQADIGFSRTMYYRIFVSRLRRRLQHWNTRLSALLQRLHNHRQSLGPGSPTPGNTSECAIGLALAITT